MLFDLFSEALLDQLHRNLFSVISQILCLVYSFNYIANFEILFSAELEISARREVLYRPVALSKQKFDPILNIGN